MRSKIFLTVSLFWIVLVGYLVWVNGIVSKGDKSFRWDEWIWFGFIPAIVPYLFYFIWKPEIIKKYLNNNKKNENSDLHK